MSNSIGRKATILLFALLLALLVAGLVPQQAEAHGTKCFPGVTFLQISAGGSKHWAAHVPVTVNAPLTSWHVHGPRGAMLWPNSVTSHYVLVYFSWPDWPSPFLRLKPSDFQACLN
jgi:hypothetical protein